ncbi:stage II sporulation protein R [Caldanaerobacter subterraneus subsp. tengcongensis MB4]|uniref:Pro-sigma-E processing factor spoIIR n=2 Tax=Caldanaerobacter subterraneus TaxID=911092 RepID=Q8R772_CALS4|nr:stage II sporulation protein R [Caldanaerobacter subterraneus]AAM25676.1 pro-sigma-E processing factor spoIIR [Caldanaerobacter subterraneus subsp. tengcongensis MB4]KKC28734.1 pro-sigma-E processing factor spoIIR [Caldanaerobacter subterraneus subsp. pacificus DSM 12653]MCS3917446.1 stage II sporulation protein R [Caldanaerobacter subterraneus subsp. tengcongensis MB4]
MKKIIAVLLIAIISILVISGKTSENRTNVDSWSKKLIRFHVIANSDSPEDQELKLKVRDAILVELAPKLEGLKTKEESERVIKENLVNIEKVAEKIIKEEGKDYKVRVDYGVFSFPTRYYGALTVPAGKYTALKVVIGEGEGKNWWCVVFPPLCIVDAKHGFTDEKTAEEIMKYLVSEDKEKFDRSKVKFKIAELIEKYYSKLKMALAP